MKKILPTLLLSLIPVFSFANTAGHFVLFSPEGNAGDVVFTDTPYGLLIQPSLKGLTPGAHGFHVHANASCADRGSAAGGHFDPEQSGKHLGPYDANGHLGDMPVLIVDADGTATLPILAPRLKEKDLKHHAIIIHEGGDNYSDQPKKLGGGGGRIACSVIE